MAGQSSPQSDTAAPRDSARLAALPSPPLQKSTNVFQLGKGADRGSAVHNNIVAASERALAVVRCALCVVHFNPFYAVLQFGGFAVWRFCSFAVLRFCRSVVALFEVCKFVVCSFIRLFNHIRSLSARQNSVPRESFSIFSPSRTLSLSCIRCIRCTSLRFVALRCIHCIHCIRCDSLHSLHSLHFVAFVAFRCTSLHFAVSKLCRAAPQRPHEERRMRVLYLYWHSLYCVPRN